MSHETYPAALQAMIDRAATITADEARNLGDLWESQEGLILPEPSIANEIIGGFDVPVVTNVELIDAWERALHAAGDAGRVTEIEAAREAGRSASRDLRFAHDSAAEKNGTEEAVRSAVLAVGVADLIPEDDFRVLVAPWSQALGDELLARSTDH